MIEMDSIKLENQKDYIILDEMIIDNSKYIYLINPNDIKDIAIREVEDNGDLNEVTDKNCFNKAMITFMKKHRNDFTN